MLVTYKEALQKHSTTYGHVSVMVFKDPDERNRRLPSKKVRGTLDTLTDLSTSVRVFGVKVPGCSTTGKRGHYLLDLDEMNDREQYQFWIGASSGKLYQPVFEIMDLGPLISWVVKSFSDPTVSGDLPKLSNRTAIKYCLGQVEKLPEACFIMYGGSFALYQMVLFINKSKIGDVSARLVDECNMSDRFALYASNSFKV